MLLTPRRGLESRRVLRSTLQRCSSGPSITLPCRTDIGKTPLRTS